MDQTLKMSPASVQAAVDVANNWNGLNVGTRSPNISPAVIQRDESVRAGVHILRTEPGTGISEPFIPEFGLRHLAALLERLR
jgi:hypothetical protein